MTMRYRGFHILLLAALFAAVTPAAVSAQGQSGAHSAKAGNPADGKHLEDEVLVLYRAGTDADLAGKIEKGLGASWKSSDSHGRVRRLKVRGGITLDEALAEFRQHPNVEYAEPNFIADLYFTPNDPHYSLQWNMAKVQAGTAWDTTAGAAAAAAVVAVLDTGVAYESYAPYCPAPDLAGTCFVAGWDFINNDSHPNDDHSHGTHVAGTIAGTTNNGLGVAGLAHDACIMPVKVLDAQGSGSYAAIANGILYAADNGADVINMSLGGSASSATLANALKYAYDKGVTLVAAAGNNGQNVTVYPAGYNDWVIAVGATRFDDTRPAYSNFGPNVDLVAPGGDTSVNQNGDAYADGILQNTLNPNTKAVCDFNYWFFQGTSMATPHVAALAAMVVANGNATTPADVRCVLEATAVDLGAPGRDDTYGWGRIDAAEALGWNCGGTPPEPTVELFNDSFENGEWNGRWTEDSQNDWYSSTQRATSGGRSAEADGSAADAQLVSIPIALAGHSAVSVRFNWLIESGVDSGEYLAFDVSTDGGSTWVEKSRLRGDVDTENTWHSAQVDLTALSSLRLRFRARMTLDTEDANVDDVRVTAASGEPPPNAPPAAGFGYVCTYLNCSFTESSTDSDGTIASRAWDFGDGATSNEQNPTHNFASGGNYTVSLTVTDNGGATDSFSTTVSVADPPTGSIEAFSDSFENGDWNGLWTEDSQNDWFTSSQRAASGSRSAEVDGWANNAALMSVSIPPQGRTLARITFDWYIESGLDTGEYIALDVSTNGGTNWTEMARLRGNVDAENAWQARQIDVNVSGASSLRLRFRGLMSDSSEDANVDTVTVTLQ